MDRESQVLASIRQRREVDAQSYLDLDNRLLHEVRRYQGSLDTLSEIIASRYFNLEGDMMIEMDGQDLDEFTYEIDLGERIALLSCQEIAGSLDFPSGNRMNGILFYGHHVMNTYGPDITLSDILAGFTAAQQSMGGEEAFRVLMNTKLKGTRPENDFIVDDLLIKRGLLHPEAESEWQTTLDQDYITMLRDHMDELYANGELWADGSIPCIEVDKNWLRERMSGKRLDERIIDWTSANTAQVLLDFGTIVREAEYDLRSINASLPEAFVHDVIEPVLNEGNIIGFTYITRTDYPYKGFPNLEDFRNRPDETMAMQAAFLRENLSNKTYSPSYNDKVQAAIFFSHARDNIYGGKE